MKKKILQISTVITGVAAIVALSGCSTMKTVFATPQTEATGPISNPFADYDSSQRGESAPGGTIVRSKKGDRSLEVEFPESSSSMGSVTLPVAPDSAVGGTALDPIPSSYEGHKPVMADREISAAFPKVQPENEADRRAIESTLGVMASENDTPRRDSSYLAAMDHVKQLYKAGRYEAALIEVDELLRLYPTNPRLYEMRGTLFDRLGNAELALKSWNQSLKLQPSNQGLKKYVERKRQIRGLASDAPGESTEGGTR